jgi:hypothetical protein
MHNSRLLIIDGFIDLLLGGVLVLFPRPLVIALGIPTADHAFYPSILGAVLLGIGVALVIEFRRRPGGVVGLGLGGAVAINLCGGLVLAGWLVFGTLHLAPHGYALLWGLAILIVGLSVVESYTFATAAGRKRPP